MRNKKTYEFEEPKEKTVNKPVVVKKVLKSDSYLGLQMQKMRFDQDLDQEEVASFLGITRASICNIEAGRHEPNIEKIKKLCELFKCSSTDLLGF